MMVPVIGMAVLGHRAIGVPHRAVGQMSVVMGMFIDGQRRRRPAAEQLAVLAALRHRTGRALAAHMTVQADDAIGRGHHHMQIV